MHVTLHDSIPSARGTTCTELSTGCVSESEPNSAPNLGR